jgi:pSer/pThr/pTyr-binding forkhead associated (FHA) protein
MASIIINKDKFRIDELELKHGDLSVGRNSDNDIHLDDSAVSGHHAKIVTLFNSSYIEDLGSTNGTYVNGKQTKKHTLHNGDVITMGNYQLMFVSKEEAAVVADSNETMMLDRSDLDRLIAESKAAAENKPVRAEKVSSAPSKSFQADKPIEKKEIPPATDAELKILQNVKAKMESAEQATQEDNHTVQKPEEVQASTVKNRVVDKAVKTENRPVLSTENQLSSESEEGLPPFVVNLLIIAGAIIAVILLFMFRAT